MLIKRNRIEEEEEDEVFPWVGVAPPVSSLPDKVHTHPLLPLYRIFFRERGKRERERGMYVCVDVCMYVCINVCM